MNNILLLLADTSNPNHIGGFWEAVPIINAVISAIILLCSIFVVAIVLVQPSNSSGIGAISGQSETFYSKNKGKTTESNLKELTVIASIILAVCCILLVVLNYIR